MISRMLPLASISLIAAVFPCQAAEEPATAPEPTHTDTRGGQVATLAAQVKEMREELDALWKLTGLADQRPDQG